MGRNYISRHRQLLRRVTRGIILHGWIVVVTITAITITQAQPAVSALTTLSKNYSTTEPIPLGAIVSLVSNTTDQVVASASSNVEGLLGVAINVDNSLLSLAGTEDNQVQVATSGTLPVLVSTINGPIARGDHITASPISGVGMKATGNVRVIGIAQGDFDEGDGSIETYKDSEGVEKTVTIGEIPVLVNVSYFFKEPDKTIIPTAIQNVANALAGKEVKTTPILISAGIFIVTIVVVVSIVYSMIRNGIISVGRNPMSQSAIYRDLVQMSALVIVILAVGLIAIYLVLTRL